MRKFYLTSLFILSQLVGFSQTSMAFYNLGDATYQNTQFNPAFMPEGRVFIGLPVISGVHVHANNRLSYNDLIRKEGTDNIVDVENAISKLGNQNLISGHANISLLHLGYRLNNGLAVSLFANERVEADILYPQQLVEFIWQGNGPSVGNEIDLGSTAANVSHFREIGIGAAYEVSDQLRVGARLKMFQGFLNYNVPGNMEATLDVDPQTYEWNLAAQNVAFRSSGVNIYSGDQGDIGSHLVSPGNSGFGVDVGFEYKYNSYLSFAASLVDVGYIAWNTDIENRQFNDTTFVYNGVNTRNTNDLLEAVQDSLFDKFSTSTNTDTYSTFLPTRAYGSMTYSFDETTDIVTSVGARYIQGQFKMLYGFGVRKQFGPLLVSANAIKLPQQFVNVGLGLAVKGGPIQYYIAADQVMSFSVPDAKAFDFRMGMNFIFGKGNSSVKGNSTANSGYGGDPKGGGSGKGINTNSFLGQKVKTKRRQGIYSIIGKQKKRKVPKSKPRPKFKR